jgi:hypothetical protein
MFTEAVIESVIVAARCSLRFRGLPAKTAQDTRYNCQSSGTFQGGCRSAARSADIHIYCMCMLDCVLAAANEARASSSLLACLPDGACRRPQ